MRARVLWAMLLLLIGCGDSGAGRTVVNRCRDNNDCDSDARCDSELGMCVSEGNIVPYEVVLQVSPSDRPRLVKRMTMPGFMVSRGSDTTTLEVPRAVTIRASVQRLQGMDSTEPVNVQIAFTPVPEKIGYPVAAVVASGKHPVAQLAPGTSYRVSIQPLGAASESLPPVEETFTTGTGDGSYDYLYSDVETLSGKLVDEAQKPQGGRWLRLKYTSNGAVFSSTCTVASDGSFSVGFLRGALDYGKYAIQINLREDDPWRATIEVDPARLDATTRELTIPVVPELVEFRGAVEATNPEGTGASVKVPSSELTFVSSFPIPSTRGNVQNRDWCRSHVPNDTKPPFVCYERTRAVTGTSEPDLGRFSVRLLPGDYQVFIAPGRDNPDQRAIATKQTEQVIETWPEGIPQEGQLFTVSLAATAYSGYTINTRREPLPNVLIRALALRLAGTIGEVARYNRSPSAVTDEKGFFQLFVDAGYYDLVAQAPEESNYASVYLANRIIDPAKMDVSASGFKLPVPVVLSGTVSGEGAPLKGATIEAFSTVNDLQTGRRAILIGQTTADDEGKFRLLLPPSIQDGSQMADDELKGLDSSP